MSDRICFAKDGNTFNREGNLGGLNSLILIELRLKLMDLIDEIDALVDTRSAEGQLNYEIASRMGKLAARAHAAGMLSAMWNDQQNRFYRERQAIEALKHVQGHHE